MKELIRKLLPYVLVVAITIGCAWLIADKKFQDKYDAGYESGRDNGYESGYSAGYSCGQNDEREKHEDLINFVNDNVVFCTDHGKKYHKFDCYHFQNNRDEFFVFSVEYAEPEMSLPSMTRGAITAQ